MPESQLIAVDIVALVEDQANGSPIVVLHDRQHNRLLPIWIGDPEARAIAIALNKMRMPRPLTHKLLLHVIEAMDGKFSRIVVDRLKNHTYFASLYIQSSQKTVAVDCRPSDAIALALEAKMPIFVEKKVMDEAGQDNPFPGIAMRQEKREFKEEDLAKLKELLEKARAREQNAGGE
jgi:bifunctional DNase/RNase